MKSRRLCPCYSGKMYEMCCKPFHFGQDPLTALELMRSRFSAYALGLCEYIIKTTHPKNLQVCHDTHRWAQEISEFCAHTQFKNLDILEFEHKGEFATVTFFADLIQNEKDVSFTEKSIFEKVHGRWLYLSGKIIQRPGLKQ